MTRSRARAALARVHPLTAGIGAYALAALVVHDVAALVVLALVTLAAEVVIHRRSRVARPGWRPSRVVELVVGAALVRRDGIVRPVLGLLVSGALAVALGTLGVLVVLTAAHGLALIAGAVFAGLVALWHHHERLAVR